MMKDILIKVNSKTSQVILPTDVVGINRENLQGNLIFEFEDNFVDGTARLEINKNGTKTFLMATKNGNKYIIPILSSLLDCPQIDMQLVITESEEDAGIPIFKSRIFYLKVLSSINAQTEEPEEYPEWIDEANARLADIEEAIEEVDNLNITVERVTDGVNVNITDKNGNTTTTIVNDGQNGTNGSNGKSLEYNWNGTSLGIRQEGQTQYQYTNLQGEQGPAGQNGQDGANGQDGFSPIANVTEVTNGVKVTITDKNGTTEAVINNGTNGQDGYTPVKGTDYFTSEDISEIEGDILNQVNQFSIQVVESLPTENIDDHTIYFVPKETEEENDIYDEYIYVNSAWEHIRKHSY